MQDEQNTEIKFSGPSLCPQESTATKNQLLIQVDDMVQRLDLIIEYDHEDMDMVTSMTLRTTYQRKEIVATGTVWPFDDAYSELQRKLPENVQIKCCVACRHGNQCPYGNAPDEVFCTKDVIVRNKMDACFYTSEDDEADRRSRHFSDACDDFCPQNEETFTYSTYLYFLKNK